MYIKKREQTEYTHVILTQMKKQEHYQLFRSTLSSFLPINLACLLPTKDTSRLTSYCIDGIACVVLYVNRSIQKWSFE